MFCKQCGKPIDDGQELCEDCSKTINENPINEVFPKVAIIIKVAKKSLFSFIILPTKYASKRLKRIKAINIKINPSIFSSRTKG